MTSGFEAMRRAMVVSQLRTNGVTDVRVLDAMGSLPRERFVPESSRAAAYIDRAVPLGGGRVINPPLATALLFDAAAISESDRMLVIGCGTGYPLALAARLGGEIVGVECDSAFAAASSAAVPGATVISGPLELGAEGRGPYDVIIIDGAVEELPDALVAQLKVGGRIATGIVESGVTRLALGRRSEAGFGLTSFLDSEVGTLPGFAKPRAFVF